MWWGRWAVTGLDYINAQGQNRIVCVAAYQQGKHTVRPVSLKQSGRWLRLPLS